MMFDKIFRGYRIVSKSSTISLSEELVEEINIGFYTDYMSSKNHFRNVGDSITVKWSKNGNTTLILPEQGVSENSMQLKGFLDWYKRFTNPTIEKVIERLAGYGFTDITEDELLKSDLQKLLGNYSEQKENFAATENEMINEIEKYDTGHSKLSQLKQYIENHNATFISLTAK